MRSEKRDGEELLSWFPLTLGESLAEAKPQTPLFARLLTRVPAALSVTETFVRVPSCSENLTLAAAFRAEKIVRELWPTRTWRGSGAGGGGGGEQQTH